MADLRQILSQGRKRVGLLIGAGAPTAINVDEKGNLDENGSPLIPDVARLTNAVVEELDNADKKIVDTIKLSLKKDPNIEDILTQIRRLSEAIGTFEVHGVNGDGYKEIAERICAKIGQKVGPLLPQENNPYVELVSWISGTPRDHPIEIFTPNYDLLLEEAFERARVPYFDGFTGAHQPFFDSASISDNQLPSRWSRLWKLHGSLGWQIVNDVVTRSGNRNATNLIYPDHLKYDQISRQPYSALFDRLRNFLLTPDSLLICSGFSFGDAHICAVLDETLASNKHAAVLAFQYNNLSEEKLAEELALNRSNLSIYARDSAVVYGVPGKWRPGQLLNDEWQGIRSTFWHRGSGDNPSEFTLGDFANLARFFSLAQASNMDPIYETKREGNEGGLETTLTETAATNAKS
jgi:hypothetical protein